MTFLFSGCSKNNESGSNGNSDTAEVQTTPISKSAFKLNTIVFIALYDSTDESIIDEALELCDYYENLLSRTIATSEISKINESALIPVTVSEDTYGLLEKGLYYSRLSNGAFDITVEPLTSLWNFSSSSPKVPPASDIELAVSEIDYEKVLLENRTVTLEKEGMGIDLGAIAKGYVADKIKEFLLSKGVNSAMINLGGNVLCVGEKPDGSAFKVGIQKPFENRNETIAVMELTDKSVVSSGIYERYFVEDGISYHHILNPSTGYPYNTDLVSVTIISDHSTDGDGLSTVCFALGLEKGLELINSLEDTYAVFITSDYELHYSEGFKENIPTIEQ
ncbi:MAG: FAD:protein FMN transferase [Lachnospiraceae bacterium]|nr:FAD:protein FMN transferase [Lachnospiraceae bacterium]